MEILLEILRTCWRRKWQPTPVFLPGKSHGQRSLVGYSPWGHKESDMTEQLHFLFLGFEIIKHLEVIKGFYKEKMHDHLFCSKLTVL